MTKITQLIERYIRKYPHEWAWMHRRWKSRPRHERKRAPMPARLRHKLESLPWMTQTELDRIVALSNDPDHREVGAKV